MNALVGHFKSIKQDIITICILIIVLFAVGVSGSPAQEPDNGSVSLIQSIEESLQLEKNLLVNLEQDLNRTRQLEPTLAVELETYKVLYTSYTNMLARQLPDPESMEQAAANVKAAIIRIRDRLDSINKKNEALGPLRKGMQEQLDSNAAYLQELRSLQTKSPEEKFLIKNLQALIDTINKKRQNLEALHAVYQLSITKMETVLENLLSLSNRLDAGINQSRTSSRFVRRTTLFAPGGWDTFQKEIRDIFEQLNHILSVSYIKNEMGLLWKSASSFLAFPVLIFLLVTLLAFRIRKAYLKIWDNPFFKNCPVFRLAWRIFNRSVFLLVITGALFVLTQINRLYVPVHFFIALFLLQLFLFTQWALDMISGISRLERIDMAPAFAKRLRTMIILVQCYISIYIVIAQLLQSGSIFLAWMRLVFEILLVAWCLKSWKEHQHKDAATAFTGNRLFLEKAAKLVAYLIGFGGLGIEIAGYSQMAFYWYASWGRTLIIGLWAVLLIITLRELATIYQVSPDQDKDLSETSGHPVTWLFLKLGQPVVIIFFLIAVVLSWGGKQAFLIGLLETLRHTYRIGTVEFSIMGFIYALIVLLITHLIAQSWRHVFQHKLLSRSGMVVGLQESLTTISVYLLWGLGVLIALTFIGLNTTTMAVAFGALGIGLGFGLQNIFNNFVSGIILLLERPIQVGDDIQVNDIWATVRKINVRSTIVQTYDNASLIIPNSDLISNQVTNWSFKDKRLRRNVMVGVAYGSDIELVRQTLLEAADSTPRALKQPKPDVLFKDFGDNALVFNLRFWTHIAYFMSVETEVRFTIDRLFREKGIVIAFPQRDIHVFYENQHDQQE